jgi:hypothetical protein
MHFNSQLNLFNIFGYNSVKSFSDHYYCNSMIITKAINRRKDTDSVKCIAIGIAFADWKPTLGQHPIVSHLEEWIGVNGNQQTVPQLVSSDHLHYLNVIFVGKTQSD